MLFVMYVKANPRSKTKSKIRKQISNMKSKLVENSKIILIDNINNKFFFPNYPTKCLI